MTRSLLAAAALTLAAACGGGDEQRAPPRDTLAARAVDSVEALAYLAALDNGEVQSAQVGTRRATSTEVRQFAQLLWREHAKSGRDVAELARQMNVDLRTAAPSSPMIANLRTRSQQATQQLMNMPRGAEFDRAYVAAEVRAHQAVLQDLRRIGGAGRVSASVAPGGGVDVGITGIPDTAAMAAAAARAASRTPETAREAAQLMLRRVQQHLERARQLQARLGATASPAPRTTAPAPRRPGGARP